MEGLRQILPSTPLIAAYREVPSRAVVVELARVPMINEGSGDLWRDPLQEHFSVPDQAARVVQHLDSKAP